MVINCEGKCSSIHLRFATENPFNKKSEIRRTISRSFEEFEYYAHMQPKFMDYSDPEHPVSRDRKEFEAGKKALKEQNRRKYENELERKR